MNKLSGTPASFAAPTADDLRSDATERAFATLLRSVGRQTTKANKQDLERRKALGDTIGLWLETLDEEQRIAFFLTIESVATATNRRKIATHPLRPKLVDEMLAEGEAETEAEADEQRPEDAQKRSKDAQAEAGKGTDNSGSGEAS